MEKFNRAEKTRRGTRHHPDVIDPIRQVAHGPQDLDLTGIAYAVLSAQAGPQDHDAVAELAHRCHSAISRA